MGNKKRKFTAAAVALTGVLLSPVSGAQEAIMNSDAVERFQASMDYLAGLKAFTLETHSTIEVVLHDGQKLQFDTSADVTVQRPDKFHARRLGDLVDQEFFYDGKQLTLQDSSAGYHASMPAPGTLEEMLDMARDELDIVAPAGDFIYRDAFEIMMDGVESAMFLGASYVEGQICDHLAFSAPDSGVDWQIWIQRGETPLPRRIVITSRDVLNAPQFTVHIRDWDLQPAVANSDFQFDAGENSTEIEFITIGADASN